MIHRVLRIQGCWRGHRCRRLLARAQTLPCDLWRHVRMYLREEDHESRVKRCVARIISVRVLRMRFSPARAARAAFPSTSRLVRLYRHILPADVLHHAIACAIRILETRSHFPRDKALVCANVLLEELHVN